MGSKISKQKEMFSLLNNKFANMWDETVQTTTESAEFQKAESSDSQSYQLLNKVYNFYKSIIQNLSSGLLTLDLEGGITFANHAAACLLGIEREDLLKKNIREIFAADEESQKSLRALFIHDKRINEKEVYFVQKNGSTIRIGFSSSQIHDENNNFDVLLSSFGT